MNLRRRQFVAEILVLASLPTWAQSTRRSGVVLHEVTELAWILAGLSGLARNGEALNRNTDYWRKAEAWFEPFAGHPAVTAFGDDFNLPRLIGNAANYDFDGPGRLVRMPGSRPMWDDGPGDLFTRHCQTIQAFASQSRARTFLAEQNEALESARSTYAGAVDLADMQAWLEQQFTARPGPMQVYVSPVTGGWNFTNLDPVTPRLWVRAGEPANSDYERFMIVRGTFTELDHNYVNPATTRLDPNAINFMTAESGWATAQAWEDYNSAELVVNEYMTFAAFLAYAQDRLSGEDLVRVEASTRRMMEQRGFPKFAAYSLELQHRRAVNSGSIEKLYPEMQTRAMDNFMVPLR